MQSRYSKVSTSSAASGSSLNFGRSGASALSLYTNSTSNKRNTSSGYTSDHYTSPSSLHSLPGYVSDACNSHVPKGSYQSNPYGSSSGLKSYSAYPYSSGAMSRNLSTTSTNKSRVPSITYSYGSSYARNLSPTAPKYVPYNSRSSSSQNTFSSHFDKNNNTNNRNNEVIVSNKAPADFTSDSEDSDTNDVEMRTHTNMIFTSRATSPNRDISHLRMDSISSTQQIIRPKKIVFGVQYKKDCKQTQVSEQDLMDSLRASASPVRSPCRSLTPTYTPTPTLSPIHSPSQSPSPVRMRYGCTPNRRSNSGSNINRYSMPIIRSPTTATDYSNYNSIIESNYSHTENRIPAQPSQSNETQSVLKESSFDTMPAISETNENKYSQELTGDSCKDVISSDQNNNNLLGVDTKSTPHRRSIIRLSPTAVRRRRSKSRNKLSGRSRSRSREKFLDREESSATLTSSSEDEDNRSGSERHARIKKKKNSNKIDEIQYKGNLEGINEITTLTKENTADRSASTDLPKSNTDGNRSSKSTGSTNESSSSSEKVIV